MIHILPGRDLREGGWSDFVLAPIVCVGWNSAVSWPQGIRSTGE